MFSVAISIDYFLFNIYYLLWFVGVLRVVFGESGKKFDKFLIFFIISIDVIRILVRMLIIRGQAEG